MISEVELEKLMIRLIDRWWAISIHLIGKKTLTEAEARLSREADQCFDQAATLLFKKQTGQIRFSKEEKHG